jgi:hypothetical protein
LVELNSASKYLSVKKTQSCRNVSDNSIRPHS